MWRRQALEGGSASAWKQKVTHGKRAGSGAQPPQQCGVTLSAGADSRVSGPWSPISHRTPSPLQPWRPGDRPAASGDVQDVVNHQQTFLALSNGGFCCPPICIEHPALRMLCEAGGWGTSARRGKLGTRPPGSLPQLCSLAMTLSQLLSPSVPQFPHQH